MTVVTRDMGMGNLLGKGYETYSLFFEDKNKTQGNMVCISSVSEDGKNLYLKPFAWKDIEIIQKAQGIVESKLIALVQPGAGNIDLQFHSEMAEKLKTKEFNLILKTNEGNSVDLGSATAKYYFNDAEYKYIIGAFANYARASQKMIQVK